MSGATQDRVLCAVIGGFVGGIFVRSLTEIGFGFALFLLLMGGVFLILPFLKGVVHSDEPRDLVKSSISETRPPSFYKGGISLIAIFFFSFGIGIIRFNITELLRDTALDASVEQAVVLRGMISDEPDRRDTHTNLTVSLQELDVSGTPRKVHTKALISTDLHSPFLYGDEVELRGKLTKPKNFMDPQTGREFDYIHYLGKDGIYYQLFNPKIEKLSSGNGNVVVTGLFKLKESFTGNLSRLIPEPESGLLGGLVVGAKQSLGATLLEDFRKAGVIHIVVLSGYNITIVADAIRKFLGFFLSKTAGLSFGALGIFLFAIMTGASATVVRSSVMALLALLAKGSGRTYQITRALIAAGFLMVLQNPQILVFDISFELSFLATLALILVSPLIEPRLSWVPEWLGIRSVVTATLSTQLFVLPFILYQMGLLSIVALPVNLLILFVIPTTMFFGFMAGTLGFVWNILAAPFAFIAYGLLAYILGVVEWFAHLPFAAATVHYFPLWLMVLWYGAYAAILFVWHKKKSTGAVPAPVLS